MVERRPRVLLIGPSNIGDAILAGGVLHALAARYPQAHLTLVVGERAKALFAEDPRIQTLVDTDRFDSPLGRVKLAVALWRYHPHVVVDLRHTLYPLLLKPLRAWRYLRRPPKVVVHMRDRHLWTLHAQLPGIPLGREAPMWWSAKDAAHVEALWRRWQLDGNARLIVICPGARSHIKRWTPEGFARVADRLIDEAGVQVVFSGEPDEKPVVDEILGLMRHRALSAVGLTTIRQLGALMRRAQLVITNDSAALHLASAVDAPTLALFGPTDAGKYGPTAARRRAIRRRLFCAPCERPLCRFSHECMRFISADEVFDAAITLLRQETGDKDLSPVPRPLAQSLAPRRILVIRLDRLGDVVLSTPVLQALRERFPHAVIAMLVRPPCRDAVEGHPSLNEVIIYDKDHAHRSLRATLRFARSLRRHEFDTALVLHPSNRSHWIPWLARIPVRIGYDRKSGWLLTHRLPHRKQEGAKHEAAYTLELLAPLGISPADPSPVVPVHPEAVERVGALLAASAVGAEDRLVAIHPSASCVSKRWMPERFAEVADRLMSEQRVRVCLVAGEPDAIHAEQVARAMRQPALNFAGRLSVSELVALLGRCRLLLSNDSGPVHLAAAVGTPVVDIFGRNQAGLSPQRWGPLGEGHVVLHKEVGCVTCLAHNCDIGFLCLTELSVDEVYRAVVSVLARG